MIVDERLRHLLIAPVCITWLFIHGVDFDLHAASRIGYCFHEPPPRRRAAPSTLKRYSSLKITNIATFPIYIY